MVNSNKNRANEDLLVMAAQGGDTRAFEALFKAYNPALKRFAYRLSSNEQLAVDAVQEAWITLSKTLRRLRDPRGFRIWAYKTVRWRVTDMARGLPPISEPLDAVPESAATMPNLEPEATSDQLSALMKALSDAERQILALFYLEEMKMTEIAAVLDIPVGTVKSRLSAARGHLREKIEPSTTANAGSRQQKLKETNNVQFR